MLFLAILIYRLWTVEKIWLILRDTIRESVMILTIIATAVLFGYMLTSLYLTQTLAQAIADLHVNKWVLMFLINIFLSGLRVLHPAGGHHPDDRRRSCCPLLRQPASTRSGLA